MKILLVRFSSLGDIVLTTPVIRTLKRQLNAEVHYATKACYKESLEANPYLEKMHLLGGSLSQFASELRKENFDCIIDLHSNLRSRRLKWKLRKTSYAFKKLNWKKLLLVSLKIDLLPNVHVVDRYMGTVAPLGVTMDDEGLDYFIPEKDEVEPDWLPLSHRSGYAAVVVGAKYKTKQLPVKRLIELCDRINKPIVLVGGKEDVTVGNEIEQFFRQGTAQEEQALEVLNKKTVIFNGCGKFNLNQSASLLQQANWVFTHDTGMMHIASAFQKPIFSIWGNTVPSFGMYPYRTQFTIFQNQKVSCRPCSKIGYSKCPKGHFKCMNDLVFDFYLPD